MRWRNQQKQKNQRVIDPLDFSWTLFVKWLLRDMYMWLVLSAIVCNDTRVIVDLLFSDTDCPVPDVGRNCWVRNDWCTVNIPYPCVCNNTHPSVVSAFWPLRTPDWTRCDVIPLHRVHTPIIWCRHQMETFSALLALFQGIHMSPVNSFYKGQWRRALIFSLICACINNWINNREAGVLRRHCAHYDVIVMRIFCRGVSSCVTGCPCGV